MPYGVVGGVAVGQTPYNVSLVCRQWVDKQKQKVWVCQRCQVFGGKLAEVCSGRSGRGVCVSIQTLNAWFWDLNILAHKGFHI